LWLTRFTSTDLDVQKVGAASRLRSASPLVVAMPDDPIILVPRPMVVKIETCTLATS
jgi:hypothetical protein